MLEINLKSTRLCLDFSFFAVLALFLTLDGSGFGLWALAACAVHETAHFLAMTAFGIKADKLTFYGAGVRVASADVDKAKTFRKVIIIGAGCFVNFIAAAMCFALGNYMFFAANLFTGIFNLLPLGQLDGAVLLKTAAVRCCKAENVDKTVRRAAAASVVVCAAALVFAGSEVSFTLLTTALYFIIIGCGAD